MARWKDTHLRFRVACENAVDEHNAFAVSVIWRAIEEGSTADAWKWLERRAGAFMPKAKLEHSGGVNSLDDVLKRRALSDEDAVSRGLVFDGKAASALEKP
ncbi:MAG: hypothetical protein WC130_05825 [Kiritimatiellia bacterium]